MNINFIWGPSETQRKLHIVASRKKITKPKEGGLERHSAKGDILANFNWKFHTRDRTTT